MNSKPFPNQRTVTVHPTGKIGGKAYLQIDKDIWTNAAKDLGAYAFLLFLYLACNKNPYTFDLSQVAVSNATGLTKSTYYNSFNLLVKKGYLVETKPYKFDFFDVPKNDSTR